MDEIKNKLINYIAEEQADIEYYREQIRIVGNSEYYLALIEESREAIATYYDKLMSLGLTREDITREVAYA